MEVGGYTLDLYCDDSLHDERRKDRGNWTGNSLDGQFFGQTYAEAKKSARAVGWKWRDGEVICPHCVKVKTK